MQSTLLRNRSYQILSWLSILLVTLTACEDENPESVDNNILGLPVVISELYQDGSQVGDLNGKVMYDGNRKLIP